MLKYIFKLEIALIYLLAYIVKGSAEKFMN